MFESSIRNRSYFISIITIALISAAVFGLGTKKPQDDRSNMVSNNSTTTTTISTIATTVSTTAPERTSISGNITSTISEPTDSQVLGQNNITITGPRLTETPTETEFNHHSSIEHMTNWIFNFVNNGTEAEVQRISHDNNTIYVEYQIIDEDAPSVNTRILANIGYIISHVKEEDDVSNGSLPQTISIEATNRSGYVSMRGHLEPEWGLLFANHNLSFTSYYFLFRSTFNDTQTIGTNASEHLEGHETRDSRLRYTLQRARDEFNEDHYNLPIRSIELRNETLRVEYQFHIEAQNYNEHFEQQVWAYTAVIDDLGPRYTPLNGTHVVVYSGNHPYAEFRVPNYVAYGYAINEYTSLDLYGLINRTVRTDL